MKRKVSQIGPATLMVSLPSKWVKRFGVKKGDELELAEKGAALVVSTEKAAVRERAKLDFKKTDAKLAERYIYAAYAMGYEEIEILHGPEIVEFKTGKKYKTTEFIQDHVNLLVGVEIIDQRENYTLIKDLGKTSEEEIETVLRRIFILLTSMGHDCLEALKANDRAVLEGMRSRHDNLSKFALFYQRILNKRGAKEPRHTPIYFYLTAKLGEISDVYFFVAQEALASKKKYGKEALRIFEMVNNSLDAFYKAFYTFKPEQTVDIMQGRAKIWSAMNNYRKKGVKEDIIMLDRIAVIVLAVLDCLEARFGLEL